MTGAAKVKGNSWERGLCEILQTNFGGNWQRVPNSGAFTGASNAFRKKSMDANQIRLMKGDIIPAAHMPKIVLECKFYADFPFHLLVREEVKQLDMWIQQTVDSADPDDTWFLCIKINRKATFIVFDAKNKDRFLLKNYCTYKYYIFTDLEIFLENNKEQVKELCK